MGITRKALRQSALLDLAKCVLGTVDSATATTITDADLADVATSPEKHVGHWVYMASGALTGQERRVTSFVPSAGTLTFGRAFAMPPQANDEYELHALLSPVEVNRLINQALALCSHEFYQEIATVPNAWQYPLAAYTWLTRPEQVWGVEWRRQVGTGQFRWLPVTWFEINGSPLVLNIRPPIGGDVFRLHCVRAYEPLATDSAVTTCPAPWATAALIYHIFEQLTYSEPAEDASRYERQMARWALILHERGKEYGPRPVGRVQFGEGPLQ